MLKRMSVAASVFALACLTVSGMLAAHDGDDDIEKPVLELSERDLAVVAHLQSYAAAFQSGDIAAIEAHVITGDGFSSLEGTYEDQGWASYRHHLEEELPLFNDVTYELTNIRPFTSATLAYATMDYRLQVTIKSDQFPDGKHMIDMKGKATMALVLDGEAWKIRHMHTARQKAKKPDDGAQPH